MRKTVGGKQQAQQQPVGKGGIILQPGMAAHDRSGKHAASKPDFRHLTRPGTVGRYERAAEWSRSSGKPLPPHMRIRTRPVRQATPMGDADRAGSYLRIALPMRQQLTGPQRRRLIHKDNHARAPFEPETG